jgi:hypothetical protein
MNEYLIHYQNCEGTDCEELIVASDADAAVNQLISDVDESIRIYDIEPLS